MSNNLNTLHHVGIVVSDMEKSKAFYSRLLGVTPKKDTTISGPALWKQTEIQGAAMRIVFLEFDNGSTGLELIEFVNKKGEQTNPRQNATGSMHFAFKVNNAKAIYEQMAGEGYNFIAEPQYMNRDYGEMNGYTFAYLRGPDGELVEIIENPGFLDKLLG
ncbi:VOC family protein [Mucilaginibacter corticis]|nr:VOC family protein [Mucilaginibacter corticis]